MCKRRPFSTVAAYDAAQQTWAERRSDASRQGKSAFSNARSKHAKTHFSQYLFEVPPFFLGMNKVVAEILHVGDLNIGKQMHKQGTRRHCDPFMLEKISNFFGGMGVDIKMKTKKDGKMAENWFKASTFAEMVLGTRQFPGGAPAWVPSLVLLIGNLRLDQRTRIASDLGEPSVPPPPTWALHLSLQVHMRMCSVRAQASLLRKPRTHAEQIRGSHRCNS